MNEGLVLEEVEMLPGAGFPVMDRLINFSAYRTRKTFFTADYIKVDLSLIRNKTDVIHSPWRR